MFVKRQHVMKQVSGERPRWNGWLRVGKRHAARWATTDGVVWLHLLKTVTAALLAMGIAMLLDLPQPRTAMTTVFVLMQPMSGMVLAKSFYRIVGTAVGMVAALLLGALFSQQPELYMVGITCWVGACTAAAVRNRHFRWYGFVLAGYTAALIGIPAVMAPNTLFLGALTRAAEVTLGIVCSSAVSALILPMRSGTVLLRTLRRRMSDLTALAANVLAQRIERGMFERKFADLVDEIVGFEATRTFASFEDPYMRARSRRFARLNSGFMDACARLHALHQLLKRLNAVDSTVVIDAIAPYFEEIARLLGRVHEQANEDETGAADAVAEIRSFHAALPKRARQTRRSIEQTAPAALLDFDTAMELLYRFVGQFVGYAQTYASLSEHSHVLERSTTQYMVKTSRYVVVFTLLRTVLAVGAMGWFWIATAWPSGGLAVIGAAITCALTSTSPNAPKLAAQMAVGVLLATLTGYVFTCYVYPNIDGFPLLCAVLVPALACGAFLATRPRTSGYGIGFSVFFCLLAGPDNVITYVPDLLINNGLAVAASMLVSAVAFAVIFPPQMPWLVERIKRDLRRQVALACDGTVSGLNERFQSSTHDLMYQLRMLLTGRSRRHRDAMRWMLATLEVGHAVVDLRNELLDISNAERSSRPRWIASIDAVRRTLPRLFDQPDPDRLRRALTAVNVAIRCAQRALQEVVPVPEARRRMQRIISYLHFIRTALLDRDAPFHGR